MVVEVDAPVGLCFIIAVVNVGVVADPPFVAEERQMAERGYLALSDPFHLITLKRLFSVQHSAFNLRLDLYSAHS